MKQYIMKTHGTGGTAPCILSHKAWLTQLTWSR